MLARQAIAILRERLTDLPFRVVELVARDKSCEHPGQACHDESCPLARGFYDRMPAARTAAIASGDGLGRDSVRRVARIHAVCPYYLTQELVRWSDVVIGDYNYFFDSMALLHLLTLANQWRVTVLVDEAHNLPTSSIGRGVCTALNWDKSDLRRRAGPQAHGAGCLKHAQPEEERNLFPPKWRGSI